MGGFLQIHFKKVEWLKMTPEEEFSVEENSSRLDFQSP